MADKEQSIKDQIAALEGWAIDAKEKADAGNYKEAEADFKNIDVQGRRLEWRGGKYGLKHLPDLAEVKELKKKITAARAACQQALTSITSLSKLPKPEGKKPAEVAAIKKKEISLKKQAGENIAILIQDWKEARAIADAEPWLNLDVISRNKKMLEMFLSADGYYEHMRTVELWNVWWKPYRVSSSGMCLYKANLSGAKLIGIYLDGLNMEGINLSGAILFRANLVGANLIGANLERSELVEADLERANLSGANLSKANLERAILIGANLERANLENATLWGANLERAILIGANLKRAILMDADLERANLVGAYLIGANLKRAILIGANLKRSDLENANLIGANLQHVKGLTAAQLTQAKNADKARNVPPLAT